LFTGRRVAVIGGGNSAFEAAIFLAKFATEVFILETHPQISADQANQELAKVSGKIKIITNARIKQIIGDKFVRGLIYNDTLHQNQEITLPVEGIFIKTGTKPASEFINNLAELNERGELKFDPLTQQTKTPGLFVAGDVSAIKFKQIIIAAGEGAKAAMSANNYLQNIK